MKTFWTLLVSRNTAIVLLIAVSLVLLVGAALPNADLMAPADAENLRMRSPALFWLGQHFNSMKVGKSPVFGFAGILLIISTTFCSIDRIVKQVRAEKEKPSEPQSEERAISVVVRDVSAASRMLENSFKKQGWKTRLLPETGRIVMTGRKGAIGFCGSIFFHFLLVTLIAGLVFFYFTGFYATLLITEGQEVQLSADTLTNVERMPPLGVSLPPIRIRLDRFSEEYYDESTAADHTADLELADARILKPWRQTVKVNKPFSYGGIEFVIDRRGYAPRFVLFKKKTPVFDTYVALNTYEENKDSFEIAAENMAVTAQFFPDLERSADGGVYSKSQRPHNPYYGLEIIQNGQRVYRGLIGKGRSIAFGEYRMEFPELRYWITLNLVRETGIGFFFVCSMIGLAGLLVRILDPERKITAIFTPDGKAQFFSSSKHFDSLLREKVEIFARLIEKI